MAGISIISQSNFFIELTPFFFEGFDLQVLHFFMVQISSPAPSELHVPLQTQDWIIPLL
jgi:hypothetical protein